MQNLNSATTAVTAPDADCSMCKESTAACYLRSVVRVIDAMKERLDSTFTLESMARIAYFSPFHFNRTFRQVTGVPPCQYLWALRLEAATHLLTETEETVLNVCYDVGYASLGTFTRRFTEIFGVPPTRFRSLSRSGAREELMREIRAQEAMQALRDTDSEPTMTGWIETPEDFEGATLVGLFEDSIPQSKPVSCCVAAQAGQYRMYDVADGEYFLFALGLPASGPMFDTRSMLRGGGSAVKIRGGKVTGSTQIRLRPAAPTDPPILLAPPVLLGRHLEAMATPFAAAAYGD